MALGAANAQTTADYAVQLSALSQTNPAQITLVWPADPQATGYNVYRKSRDATSWTSLAALPANASNYSDNNVAVGGAYEYRVDKSASAAGSSFTGQGYIYAGIQTPLTESRGKLILLVDASVAPGLASELARLQQDLIGDGWTVLRHDVARTSSVPAVKAIVTADYNADPSSVTALFLFGHIPVPYSGNFAPDGHQLHVGAWPADVYYGNINGSWTDSTVNTTTASDSRNWNVPGDGKFDQSTLPSDVNLQVGRVDLANLPSFSQSELELLRQYLCKDHNFRFKNFQAVPRGLVDDQFGPFNGEAFAANGYRNFPPFFGAANTFLDYSWAYTLTSQSYLWGYGCGSGENTSAAGVTSASILASNDQQVVFTMLFGSGFGDWDVTDDLMRAALATPTYTLTSAWVGRPCWQVHHMALGEPIGFSTRVSQNNSTTYVGGQRTRGVHVSLMGDPTLRAHPVAPPEGLVVTTNSFGGVALRWNPSPDAVLGYHVYRAPTAAGPFTRLTSGLLTATTYSDPLVSTNVYMVRAIKLETCGSGSYYNPSQGIFQTLQGSVAVSPPRLTLTAAGLHAFLITGSGTANHTYQLEANDGLTATNWKTLASVTADSSGAFQFTDFTVSTQRAYRATFP